PSTPVALLFSPSTGQSSFSHPSWTADLSLALGPNVLAPLLFAKPSDPAGLATLSLFAPNGLQGIPLHLQAPQAAPTPSPFRPCPVAPPRRRRAGPPSPRVSRGRRRRAPPRSAPCSAR